MKSHHTQDRQSLLMHQEAVRMILADPKLIERAAQTLTRWDAIVDPRSRPLRAEWSRILADKDWAMALEQSDRGNQLRQASPLAVLLPNDVRLRIIQEAGRSPTEPESVLLSYASMDAQAAGIALPADAVEVSKIASFMARAGSVLFLPGDPNHDNQKRNIAIHVFMTFTPSQIFDFCQAWLRKWSKNKDALWYREWQAISDRANPDELADILLSHDQERVRQRISSPFGEMLDFETILRIKRATYETV